MDDNKKRTDRNNERHHDMLECAICLSGTASKDSER